MRELALPRREASAFAEFLGRRCKQPQQLMNSHWRIQYFNVFLDMIRYDEIVHYEQLPARLPQLVTELYPGTNADAVLSRHRHEQSSDEMVDRYFTPELKALAQQIYAKDFETFGYAG